MDDANKKSKHVGLYAGILFFVLSGCKAFPWETPPKKGSEEYVVFLHGLARSAKSMVPLQKALSEKGYGTCNIDYPSTDYSIEYLSETYLPAQLKRRIPANAQRIHFVTHSLGGIIVRHYLKYHSMDRLGRVVMLSPPNCGSEVVDKIGHMGLFKTLNGPAGTQLGTDPAGIPNRLGPVDFELGIITGSKTMNPLLSLMIPGKDDGKVSVQRAQVTGMTDFLVVPHTHPFIMRSKKVVEQTAYFLEHGKFQRMKAQIK